MHGILTNIGGMINNASPSGRQEEPSWATPSRNSVTKEEEDYLTIALSRRLSEVL